MRPEYLDFNSTTPVHPEVVKAMEPYWSEEFGNPASRTHIYGQRAAEAVESSRKTLSYILSCDPQDIIFTSGATESNNIAIIGIGKIHASQKCGHIITTKIEHKSVTLPIEHIKHYHNYTVDYVDVDSSGRINPDNIAKLLRDDTLLVSVMHVNNETGIIQPINEISEILANNNAYFHVDAAQGFCKTQDTLTNKRIDFISLSGHKIYGPKGIGALVRRKRDGSTIKLLPIMFGGEQERGLRPGTLATPLIVGFSKAAELSIASNKANKHKIDHIRSSILKFFASHNASAIGDQNFAINTTLGILLHNISSEAFMLLNKDIISISNGSACTSTKYSTSHVLQAMGIANKELDKFIRISISPYINTSNLDAVINKIRMAGDNPPAIPIG